MFYKNLRWNETKVSHLKKLEEVRVFTPSVYFEYRGEIFTSYHSEIYDQHCPIPFKHDRFSKSYRGVLRGLHCDDKTWKLVSCIAGDIYLVVLDLRKESPTYGAWENIIISEKNHAQVLIPPRFANGHYALTDCVFHYKLAYEGEYCDESKQTVIKWNDPQFAIEWPTANPVLQLRDR